MPKNPPGLARLLPSTDPADRVQVQQSAFSYDVTGRYVCNDWAEIDAQSADGGFGFDVVVIGAGMFGGYAAEKLYRESAALGWRILVLDAGAFLFTTHAQNLPQRLGGSVGGPAYLRTREDGTGVQNVVWGMPWISNERFPGLAYCIGGRSLFWGGWSPRLTNADLQSWPADVAAYLTGPDGYPRTEVEIGTDPTADYMLQAAFHNDLHAAFTTAVGTLGAPLDGVEEAPLAVQGSSPASGIFPFDKFSSPPWLIDAVRDDAAIDTARGDVTRRLFLVPRTNVVGLTVANGRVSALDLDADGTRRTLPIPPSCAAVLAASTIESTRLALASLGVGDTTHGSPRAGNLIAHLRSNITVRIRRSALGLPAGPPADLETTAFLVRGSSAGRRFHFQISAAAVGGSDPETNMWQQVPDIDTLDHLCANQNPDWITMVFRGIGEMQPDPQLTPNPARSWIDLSNETDQFGARRAYVNLVPTTQDLTLWATMDQAAFALAAALAGAPKNVEYLDRRTGAWLASPPQPDATGGGPWRDPLGSTHHEAGTLYLGTDPTTSIADTTGRLHHLTNAYIAGPALFPTLGSANPSLTALTLARRTAQAIVTEHTLNPPAGFAPLSLRPGDWQLVAAAGTNPAMRHLGPILETAGSYGLYWYLPQQFGNADLWIEWRELHQGDNAGIYLRIPDPTLPDALHQADIQGHEIQIDDLGAGNPTGLDIHKTGAVYGLQAPTSFPAHQPGQWNSYLIQMTGGRIQTTLNGTTINDYTSTRRTDGFLALQIHSGTIQYRNLHARTHP